MKGKIDINNLTFYPSAVNNFIFELLSNNLIFAIYLPTSYHTTNNR